MDVKTLYIPILITINDVNLSIIRGIYFPDSRKMVLPDSVKIDREALMTRIPFEINDNEVYQIIDISKGYTLSSILGLDDDIFIDRKGETLSALVMKGVLGKDLLGELERCVVENQVHDKQVHYIGVYKSGWISMAMFNYNRYSKYYGWFKDHWL